MIMDISPPHIQASTLRRLCACPSLDTVAWMRGPVRRVNVSLSSSKCKTDTTSPLRLVSKEGPLSHQDLAMGYYPMRAMDDWCDRPVRLA